MHQVHEGRGSVLFDDCDECGVRARDLSTVDEGTLQALAHLALSVRAEWLRQDQLSITEQIAIGELRRMARIVEMSGIADKP